MKWWVARDGRRVEVAVRRIGERFEVNLDGAASTVELVPLGPSLAALLCEDGRTFAVVGQELGPRRWRVSFGPTDFEVALRDPLERELQGAARRAAGVQEVRAPIPGRVVSTAVGAGDEVHAGATLVVLEAMKMENQIVAEHDGRVTGVLVTAGMTVESGQVLVVLA